MDKQALYHKLLETNDFDELLTQGELFYLGTLITNDIKISPGYF